MDLGGSDCAYVGAYCEGAGQVEDCKDLEDYPGEGCSCQVSSFSLLCKFRALRLPFAPIPTLHTRIVIDLGYFRKVLDRSSVSRGREGGIHEIHRHSPSRLQSHLPRRQIPWSQFRRPSVHHAGPAVLRTSCRTHGGTGIQIGDRVRSCAVGRRAGERDRVEEFQCSGLEGTKGIFKVLSQIHRRGSKVRIEAAQSAERTIRLRGAFALPFL